ncbi:hypothetical protein [Streptomyces marianii]|uniref:Uncharacterized protein n=1 Tax=Streptomyces marianii TaxID=1817406 RepID=A0A5R9DQS8_9ACTN|nr:hypothetical protein [Streptomyces marianii]TLQ38620.1 hypothetical protein FEF34_40805 [Streptomyces marianii]
MPEDPVSQEMARLLNEKLQRVIDKQTEHTIALANHTASLDRLEKGQERQQEVLDEILSILRGGESAGD